MNIEIGDRERRIITILVIFTIVFTFFGGSLAYFNWETSEAQRTNVVFTVEQEFACAADGGGDISSTEYTLVPTGCMDSDYAIQREITVTPSIYKTGLTISMDLWLKVNSIGTGLSNSQNFRYALTTSSTSCTDGLIGEGTFNGTSTDSTVSLFTEMSYSSNTSETYYLYVWLDSAETSSDTMNQEFDLSLGGSCTNAVSVEPSSPVLDDGMIPVVLSDDGVATTVSSTDSSWYNYKNKQWANVVLVNESSRSNYVGTTGVTVSETDILAYYVWIPRYKYKIWTTSTSSSGSEQTIEIVFESKDTAKSTGTAVDEYLTHPAFTFGDVELAGFWVGKFETTGSATTPTILPNVTSLRGQNVSTQFITSLKFAGGTLSDGNVTFSGNSTYGLTKATDSHMMKNSEWGAVAYLSHSQYGINQEIYINNSSGYYTGRSGGNVGGSVNTLATQFPESSTSTNQYNTYGYYTWTGQAISSSGTIGEITDSSLGTKASTTGNVTGVYDMSGGAWEYVMGVLSDSNGNPRSGNTSSFNSGFNGVINDNTSYTSGISFPTSKYYDLYTTTSSTTACNGGICYGHALSETSGWYSDYASFVTSSYPWFNRGGSFSYGANAGAFDSIGSNGSAYSNNSWRSVVCVEIGA